MQCPAPKEEEYVDAHWSGARLDWATLLRRVYDIDSLACPCGGRLKFVELITDPEAAHALLVQSGLPHQPTIPRSRPLPDLPIDLEPDYHAVEPAPDDW